MRAKYIFNIKIQLAFVLLAVSISSCSIKSTGKKISSKSIKVLLVGGGASHNFDLWYKNVDVKTLSQDGLCKVTYTTNTDSIAEYLKVNDVLIMSNNQPIKSALSRQSIFEFATKGKGIIFLHAALWYNWKDWSEFNLQLTSGGSRGHDRYGEFQLEITNPNHPITKGVEQKFTIKDERYYFIPDLKGPGMEVLATNNLAGSEIIYPSIFVVNNPKARIVGISLGHDGEAHNMVNYQLILKNAVKWVSK